MSKPKETPGAATPGESVVRKRRRNFDKLYAQQQRINAAQAERFDSPDSSTHPEAHRSTQQSDSDQR